MTASDEQYDYSFNLNDGAKIAGDLIKTGFSSKTEAFMQQLCRIKAVNDDVVPDLFIRERVLKKIIDKIVTARQPLNNDSKIKLFEYISVALQYMNPEKAGINDQTLAALLIDNLQNSAATQHNANVSALAQKLEESTAFFELTAAKYIQIDKHQKTRLTGRCSSLIRRQDRPKGVVYALALVNLEEVGTAMTILSALCEKGCATDMASYIHRLLPYVEGSEADYLCHLLELNLSKQQEFPEYEAVADYTGRLYVQAARSFVDSGFYLQSEKLVDLLEQNQLLDGMDEKVEVIRQMVDKLRQQHIAEEQERMRREAEEKAKREAEEKAKREAEEKAKREAEEKARREAEEKARLEAEEKARLEAEEKARLEAEEKARLEAEKEAQLQEQKVDSAESATSDVNETEPVVGQENNETSSMLVDFEPVADFEPDKPEEEVIEEPLILSGELGMPLDVELPETENDVSQEMTLNGEMSSVGNNTSSSTSTSDSGVAKENIGANELAGTRKISLAPIATSATNKSAIPITSKKKTSVKETQKGKSLRDTLKSKLFKNKLENVGEKVINVKDKIVENSTLVVNSENLDKGLNVLKDVTSSAIKLASEQTEKVKQKVGDIVKNNDNKEKAEENITIPMEEDTSTKPKAPEAPKKVFSSFYEVPFWERENTEELEQREQTLKQSYTAYEQTLEENIKNVQSATEENVEANVEKNEVEEMQNSAVDESVVSNVSEPVEENNEVVNEATAFETDEEVSDVKSEVPEGKEEVPDVKFDLKDIDVSKISNYSSLDDFAYESDEVSETKNNLNLKK